MHEVVRVVRVRHIVTHVSSIGQFFHPSAALLARRAGQPSGRASSPPRGGAGRYGPRPRAARLYKPRRRQAAAASPRAAKADLHLCGSRATTGVQFWIRKTSPPLSTESRFENRDRTSSGWPRLQGLNFNLNLRFCCPGVRAPRRAESFAHSGLWSGSGRITSRSVSETISVSHLCGKSHD